MDFWGLSQFPRGPGMQLFENAANMELARSSAMGKEFWLTELQGGDSRLDLVDGGYFMRPKDIRTFNWLAMATGAKAVVYWQYMPEGTGQESMRNGLVSRDGSTTDRVEEADREPQLDSVAVGQRDSQLPPQATGRNSLRPGQRVAYVCHDGK